MPQHSINSTTDLSRRRHRSCIETRSRVLNIFRTSRNKLSDRCKCKIFCDDNKIKYTPYWPKLEMCHEFHLDLMYKIKNVHLNKKCVNQR